MRAAALFQYKLRDRFHMCGLYVATQEMLVGLSTSSTVFVITSAHFNLASNRLNLDKLFNQKVLVELYNTVSPVRSIASLHKL